MAAISPGTPPATIARLHLLLLDVAVFRSSIPHLLPLRATRLQQQLTITIVVTEVAAIPSSCGLVAN
ncbi:hypothetical protein EJB05_40678 [Eragrostis curvula]|uniref:Uncharacterized protein n=1 Tax=Eragrostis curvula TaxID=38414 RepID=A0A5J9TP25_9POAL|nr:hypothetical protein EJB05_40678 [Eragrostis curvula]